MEACRRSRVHGIRLAVDAQLQGSLRRDQVCRSELGDMDSQPDRDGSSLRGLPLVPWPAAGPRPLGAMGSLVSKVEPVYLFVGKRWGAPIQVIPFQFNF